MATSSESMAAKAFATPRKANSSKTTVSTMEITVARAMSR